MFQLLITILFVLIPINWVTYFKKKNLREALVELLPKPQTLKKEVLGSLALFGTLFIGFIIIANVIAIVDETTGIPINDLEKVNNVVDAEMQFSLILFLVTIIVVVFIEEFFFRAFLVPRAGMIPATLIFTFFHYGYGSIAEIIGVFFLGLILAYWFKKKKSIIQNYFGHLFYNLLAIVFYILI